MRYSPLNAGLSRKRNKVTVHLRNYRRFVKEEHFDLGIPTRAQDRV